MPVGAVSGWEPFTTTTELGKVFAGAQSRAERLYGSSDILLERYLVGARHVEVQILGLVDGRILPLGERDCSVQRRHQKIAEETPSPAVGPRAAGPALRRRGPCRCNAVGYVNAGTVECLVSAPETGEFVFLEMNTRLQVEHPITEMVTGIDLVEEQLRIAAGLEPTFGAASFRCLGGQCLGAEGLRRGSGAFPARDRAPSRVTKSPPARACGWIPATPRAPSSPRTTTRLLAKLCVWGPDRETMLSASRRRRWPAYVLEGPKVNLPFFTRLLAEPDFISGDYDTGLGGGHECCRPATRRAG